MINNFGEGFDDETLMPEFDSDLMTMNTDPESDIIMEHMDIREPLSNLKKLLEHRLGADLSGYMFSLQGSQMVNLCCWQVCL